MAMHEMQKYKHLRSRFCDLLFRIIHERDCKAFNLDEFTTNLTKGTLERAKKICKANIESLFHNGPCKRDSQKIDNVLLKAKALDFENNFPWLLSTLDTFCRYVMKKNKQYWKQKIKLNSKPKTIDIQWEKPFASTWFKQSGYYKQKALTMSKKEIDCLECFGYAIESLQKRALKMINLNHKKGPIIYDSLDTFAAYCCVMYDFVCREFTNLAYSPNGSSRDHLPVQIDFCIIPRLAKTNVYNNYVDDNDDYDEKDDEEEENKESMQNFGKNPQLGALWDLETCLNKSGYVKGKDYWTCLVNCNTINLRSIWQNVKNLNLGRYKRYILMIDRRNPQHIENKQMADDTNEEQKWDDKLYLIAPKEANQIAKEYYENVLNEVFLENTKKYLFPIPGLMVDGTRRDLGGLEDANGYKFMISYHLYNKNKAKMYWYHGVGVTRFFMKDVGWLWPRYFKADKNGNFQTLSVESKNKYMNLKDSQFDDFRRQFGAFHPHATNAV